MFFPFPLKEPKTEPPLRMNPSCRREGLKRNGTAGTPLLFLAFQSELSSEVRCASASGILSDTCRPAAFLEEPRRSEEPKPLTSAPVNEVFGKVHSIESFSTVDGPGIRYVVFAQGCPCRCLFCCNPDTWDPSQGQCLSSRDVAQRMRRTVPFMKSSGGGLTVSGGEAMMQPAFVSALFQEAHEMGVTTCLDTSAQGSCSTEWAQVLEHTDLVLICIKHMKKDVYAKITRRRIAPVFRFLEELNARKIPFWIRYVLVPGLTMSVEDLELLCEFCKKQSLLKGIEFLPYHTLGVDKWKEMGLDYPLKDVMPPTKSEVLSVIEQVKEHGLAVLCDLSTTRQA